jgi:hypothetical protein
MPSFADRVGGLIIVVVFVIFPIFLGANWIAQKIYPTKSSDPSDRRTTYRVLVFVIQYGSFAALAGGMFLLIKSGVIK